MCGRVHTAQGQTQGLGSVPILLVFMLDCMNAPQVVFLVKLIYFRKNNKQRKRKIDDILRGYFGGGIPLDGSSDEGESSDSDAEADDECGMLILVMCKILSPYVGST